MREYTKQCLVSRIEQNNSHNKDLSKPRWSDGRDCQKRLWIRYLIYRFKVRQLTLLGGVKTAKETITEKYCRSVKDKGLLFKGYKWIATRKVKLYFIFAVRTAIKIKDDELVDISCWDIPQIRKYVSTYHWKKWNA